MAKAFKGRIINGQRNPLHYSLEKRWQSVIPAWLRSRGLLVGPKSMDQEWINWLTPFVNSAPIPIETVFDWLWWITYACKYQHDLMRVFYNRKEVPSELRESVINFYEWADFDQWSFHNHE